MTDLLRDVRHGLRLLRRHPGYAVAVILTLAATIGVGTVVIALVDCIVFRPLPFRGSDRVVRVWETNAEVGEHRGVSLPDLRDWAAASKSFEALAMARGWTVTLQTPSGGTSIDAGIATPQWFSIQSIQPKLGRFFREDEMRPGNNHVVVLSDDMWRTTFGANPQIVGQLVRIDGDSYRVIGVLPEHAWLYEFGWARVWIPLSAIQDDVEQRSWRGFVGIGRLAPGVTLAAARQEIRSIQDRLAAANPETNRGWGADMEFLRDAVAGPVHKMLFMFLASIGLVLAIACANVANLALAFNFWRVREFAVRHALGASGGRIARQIVVESILLALIGGLLGLAVARGGLALFQAVAPSNVPRLDEVAIDPRIAAITTALSLAAAILFGILPARAAARTRPSAGTRITGRGDLRKMLVIGELALAFVLVTATGLMTRAFGRLLEWDPGFAWRDVTVTWAIAKSGTGVDAVEMFDRAARTLETIPGVTAVGQSSAGPLFGGIEDDKVEIGGRAKGSVRWFDVSPDYFRTLGVPLLRGRDLKDSDRRGTTAVALINAAMARRYWGDADPIGQSVTIDRGKGSGNAQWEIVGVVGDIQPFRPDEPPRPEMYWPKRQSPRLATYFVIRSNLPAETMGREATEILKKQEPALQLHEFKRLDDLAAAQRVRPRFDMFVVSVLSALALLLAAIGIHGLVSFSIVMRAREIAVRLAIGAAPARVVREIVGEGATMLVAGLVLGMGVAAAVARSLSAFLFGLSPFDPLTWLAVSMIFGAVVLMACWIPASRAAAIDPAVTLRVE